MIDTGSSLGSEDPSSARSGESAPVGDPRTHVAGLDGLRAIAALAVVATHLGTLSGRSFDSAWGPYLARGDVGVAVFFVLSGFLLARPFVRSLLAGGPAPRMSVYFKRRALRIFPAYWLLFAVTAFVGIVETSRGELLSQLFLVQIYTHGAVLGPAIHGATGDLGHPLGPAWSLAVEISFYAALPVLVAGLRVLSRSSQGVRVWRIVVAIVALWAGSLAARAAAFAALSAADAGLVAIWLPFTFDWFAYGLLLALGAEVLRGAAPPRWLLRLASSRWLTGVSWGLALLAFVAVSKWAGLVALQLHYSVSETLLRQVLYGAVGCLLVLPLAIGARRSVVVRVLDAFPLAAIGLVSYGVYLWQDLVIDQFLRHTSYRYFASPFWIAAAWVVVGSIGVASVSYFAVERPMLRLKQRRLRPIHAAAEGRQ